MVWVLGVRKVSSLEPGPLVQDTITGRGDRQARDRFLHFDELRGKRLLVFARMLRGASRDFNRIIHEQTFPTAVRFRGLTHFR